MIAERTKDGAFVFHDPKLDADLNLVFEQIKIVRGMEGYGWFANVIFHDKDVAKKQYAIDFWLKPEGDKLTLSGEIGFRVATPEDVSELAPVATSDAQVLLDRDGGSMAPADKPPEPVSICSSVTKRSG